MIQNIISADVDVLGVQIQIMVFLSIGARRKSVQEERIYSYHLRNGKDSVLQIFFL